ncbi:MAG TPA: hypothetical protein VD997_04795 [Phycisphaerales bacterium]|nr:hypothetical protein [Phycisphaerales bacterium]
MRLWTLGIEPVRLVKGDETSAWAAEAWMVVASMVVLLVAISGVVLMVRARRGRDDRESAFRALASGLGLSGDARGLLRRLAAAHGAASPVALLLSDHALRQAVVGVKGAGLPRAERRALERLRADLGL